MSEQKNREDLKALEAALASLVPRTDRLDRDRLMYLAGRESLRGESNVVAGLPTEPPRSTEGPPVVAGLPTVPPGPPVVAGLPTVPLGATAGLPAPPGDLRSDTRRGRETRAEHASGPTARRWAWPAAFSAMTTLAASLLVVLLVRPGSRTVVEEKIVEKPVEVRVLVPMMSAVRDLRAEPPDLRYLFTDDRDTQDPAPLGPLARLRSPGFVMASVTGALDRILANGGPSGQGSTAGASAGDDQDPATYRTLLDSFLDNPGSKEPSRRPSVPDVLNPSGV